MDIQFFDHTDGGDLLLEGVEVSVTRGSEPVPIALLPAQVLDRTDAVGGLSPEDTAPEAGCRGHGERYHGPAPPHLQKPGLDQ